MDTKEIMRTAMVERLQRMSAKDREAESRTICKELRRVLGEAPHGIAAYMPLSDEPDIRPLLEELLTQGWTLALPRVEKNTFSMAIVSDMAHLVRGPIGPLEPAADAINADAKIIDVVLVPGRAFTIDGRRLGRGNGGYDHWLRAQRSANAKTSAIGICFDCQLVGDIPVEPHDESVDMIVTSRGPRAIV